MNLGIVYADGAYDTVDNWQFIEESEIQFYPNIKKYFEKDWYIPERNMQKEMCNAMGKKQFNVLTGNNQRWIVEVFFSVLKKLYDEKIINRLFERMIITMRHRYMLYAIRQKTINSPQVVTA